MDNAKPAMPNAPLTQSPGLWRGANLQSSQDWIYRFPLEALAEIEAEKTTETIESPAAGKITEILVTEGSTVPVRTPVAIIEKA